VVGGTAIADESASGHVNVCSGLSLVSPAGPAAGCRFAAIGDDLRLHYQDVGQGTVMVWVPGWVATTEVFSKQVEHFSRNYRVITYDPRSVGLSTKTLDHNNYTQHGRDLAAFMDKLALNNVILVGWSWGCLESYAYIRARGVGNLKAFMCIDSSPKPFSDETDDWADWTGTEASIADQRKVFYSIEADPEGFFPVSPPG
jgi:pimeloyl-ACP methyl ester carboxylesterase